MSVYVRVCMLLTPSMIHNEQEQQQQVKVGEEE